MNFETMMKIRTMKKKKKKKKEEELKEKLGWINSDEKIFNERRAINVIDRHIKTSFKKSIEEKTKKSLKHNFSKKIHLALEFKNNSRIKSCFFKKIVKYVLPEL